MKWAGVGGGEALKYVCEEVVMVMIAEGVVVR